MDTFNQSGSHKPEPASTIITTLYDLITEIDAGQGNLSRADTGCYRGHYGHTGSVIERVAYMFESGQIKFMNGQDVKRKYAELLIS